MFVTGCHRSGTSLVAAVLAALLPEDRPEQVLLAPALDNPGGFHESAALVRANEALLGRLGAAWDHPPLLPVNWCDSEVWPAVLEQRPLFRQYSLQRAWVDKDPRLAITAPAFQHILLRRPGLVVVLREPLAVARSLRSREGWSLQQGLCVWWIYNLHLATQIQDSDLLLRYDQILASLPVADHRFAVRAFLETQAGVEVSEAGLAAALQSQCRLDWSRSTQMDQSFTMQSGDRHTDLLSFCQNCYSGLESCLPSESISRFRDTFSGLPVEVITALSTQGWQGWPNQHVSLKEYYLQGHIAEILRSKSWRLMAPVRFMSNLLQVR